MMQTESRLYGLYELQGVFNMPTWQVGIYPTKSGLPTLSSEQQIVSLADKEAAFAEAQRRVDTLLKLASR